jgi:DNA-binding FadR family transcriptional regulator
VTHQQRPITFSLHAGTSLSKFYEVQTKLIDALKAQDPRNAKDAFHRHDQTVIQIIRTCDRALIRPGMNEG